MVRSTRRRAATTRAAPQTNDPLKYLKHNAEGVVLTFKLPGDFEPRNVQVEFYGRVPLQSVIVSAPHAGLGQWPDLAAISRASR